MGNTPSTQSPLTSKATNLHPISQPRSLGGHSATTTMRRSNGTRAASPSRIPEDRLTAPPPYTPVEEPQEHPPPVPPRDDRDVRRVSSASLTPTSHTRPHRRTASHSHETRPIRPDRTSGPTSSDARAPGDGVGGFVVPNAPESMAPGSSFTRANSTAARPRDSAIATSTNSATLSSSSSRHASGSTAGSTQSPTTTDSRNPARRNSREDPLDLLRKFRTVIIVDDSSSMEGALWVEARDALAGIADAAAHYDATGIDLHFLNDRRVGTNLKRAADVQRLFDTVSPRGITPTGEKLEELLLDYLLRFESAEAEKPKPVNFVILTDGAPTDDPESVIVTAAKRLDAQHAPISQVGIQFVQLGSDPEAREALREMDDELAGRHDIRDMVDTTLYTGQQLTTELLGKILLGGINRRVDRKGFQL